MDKYMNNNSISAKSESTNIYDIVKYLHILSHKDRKLLSLAIKIIYNDVEYIVKESGRTKKNMK